MSNHGPLSPWGPSLWVAVVARAASPKRGIGKRKGKGNGNRQLQALAQA